MIRPSLPGALCAILVALFAIGCATGRPSSYASTTVNAYSYDVTGKVTAAQRELLPPRENPAARGLGLPQDARSCYDRLWNNGVTFELVHRGASGVRMPIRVTSPIGGIRVQPMGGDRTHSVMDCRLALRILEWSTSLRMAGVVAIEHYSAYRPGARIAGSGKRSAHASALALDLARLELVDGRSYDVLNDWEGRSRGDRPCPMRQDEGFGSRLLRSAVCNAVAMGLFQVILTPHHDKAHQNHVHLEFRPGVSWVYLR